MTAIRIQVALVLCAAAIDLRPRMVRAQVDQHPVHWSARAAAVSIRAGDTARVAVHATIGEFFHLYSTTQGPGGPIRTSVALVSPRAVSLVGRVRAPVPEKVPDGNFGIITEVYDDSVTFGLTLRAGANLAAGRSSAIIGIRYQACTAKYCLPPRVDSIGITLVVKGRAGHTSSSASTGTVP